MKKENLITMVDILRKGEMKKENVITMLNILKENEIIGRYEVYNNRNCIVVYGIQNTIYWFDNNDILLTK